MVNGFLNCNKIQFKLRNKVCIKRGRKILRFKVQGYVDRVETRGEGESAGVRECGSARVRECGSAGVRECESAGE